MAIREEKEIKGIQIDQVKCSQSAKNIMLYIENSKHATRKLLVLKNEYSKVT